MDPLLISESLLVPEPPPIEPPLAPLPMPEPPDERLPIPEPPDELPPDEPEPPEAPEDARISDSLLLGSL
jgi:hypothetical protein